MWKRLATLIILITSGSLLFTSLDLEARGGGGGGRSSGSGRSFGGKGSTGSRGGGNYEGGRTMNRTPTMSRASSRPAASQARQQTQIRPSVPQDAIQQNRQTLQQKPSSANRDQLRSQVNQYAKSRTPQTIDPQTFAQKAQNFSSTRSNQITQNRQLSNNVSQRLQQSRPNSNQWFDRNFFDQHNIDRDYVRVGANWWRPAAWATLATWGAWRWSTPFYYDEGGYAYPVTTSDSSYTNPYYTDSTSSQQAQTQPVQGTQITASTEGDWLPLGVFAVGGNAKIASQTDRFMQLAINRSGEIAGVLYNSSTDVAQDLIGMVDPESQKAYWSIANRADSPIASTGIYNLTEDQTPINVHFADGSDQTWTLVRLQQG